MIWNFPMFDLIFPSSDDGRVIKAVNKATSAKSPIDTVTIEEIQVFADRQPIVNLQVFRRNGMEKLVVVSRRDIVSIPLHRCHEKNTCRACVRLQDPYCSWVDGECSNTDRGWVGLYWHSGNYSFNNALNTFYVTVLWKEGNVLFNDALNTFNNTLNTIYLRLYGRKEGIVLFNDALNTFYFTVIWKGGIFYLTTHSTHFILWCRTY